jgi:hypothetical protein
VLRAHDRGTSHDTTRNLQAGRATSTSTLRPHGEPCLHSFVGVVLTAPFSAHGASMWRAPQSVIALSVLCLHTHIFRRRVATVCLG